MKNKELIPNLLSTNSDINADEETPEKKNTSLNQYTNSLTDDQKIIFNWHATYLKTINCALPEYFFSFLTLIKRISFLPLEKIPVQKVLFAKTGYSFRNMSLYKSRDDNKDEGSYGYVYKLYNEMYEIKYAMKTFTYFNYKMDLLPYEILGRSAWFGISAKGQIKLITHWQVGLPLWKFSEVEQMNLLFVNRFAALLSLCRQIEKLHRAQIVHGDLTLNNIIYNVYDNQLNLIDFDQYRKVDSTGHQVMNLCYDFFHASLFQVDRKEQSVDLYNVDTSYKQDLYSLGIIINYLFPECLAGSKFINAPENHQIIFKQIIKNLSTILLDTKVLRHFQEKNGKQSLIVCISNYCEKVLLNLNDNLNTFDQEILDNLLKETIGIVNIKKIEIKNSHDKLNFSSYKLLEHRIDSRKKISINQRVFYEDNQCRIYTKENDIYPTLIKEVMPLNKAVKELKFNHLLHREAFLLIDNNLIAVMRAYVGDSLISSEKEFLTIPLDEKAQIFINLLEELSIIHRRGKLYANPNISSLSFDKNAQKLHLNHFHCSRKSLSKKIYNDDTGRVKFIAPAMNNTINSYLDDLKQLMYVLAILFPDIIEAEEWDSQFKKGIRYLYNALSETPHPSFTAARLTLYFKSLFKARFSLTASTLEEIKNDTLFGLTELPSDRLVGRLQIKTNASIRQKEIIDEFSEVPMIESYVQEIRTLSLAKCERFHFKLTQLRRHGLLNTQTFNEAFKRIKFKLPTIKMDDGFFDDDDANKKRITFAHNGTCYYLDNQRIQNPRFVILTGYKHPVNKSPAVAIKYPYDSNQISDKRVKREAKYHCLLGAKNVSFFKAIDSPKSKIKGVIIPWYQGENLANTYFYNDIESLTFYISFLEQLVVFHRNDRIHGDISASNVIVNLEKKAVLIDFEASHQNFSKDCYFGTKPFNLDNNSSFQRDMFASCVILQMLFKFIVIQEKQVDVSASLKKPYWIRDEIWEYDEYASGSNSTECINTKQRQQAIVNLASVMINFKRLPPCTADRTLAYCQQLLKVFPTLTDEKLQLITQQTLDAPIQAEDVLQMGAFSVLNNGGSHFHSQ